MNWSARCAAVIPCRNEQAAITGVVTGARTSVKTIYVVDDGSTDDTARLAEKSGATVIRHDRPLGKGSALTTGWNQARRDGFEWAIALDGDGQHSSHDIPAFFERAEATGATLVVGNRMHNPADMPWLRRKVNRWMSRKLSDLAGVPLPDSQCGFRLMNLVAWSELDITATHYEIESDVLLAFARARHRIEFVPIRVIYNSEQSKIRPLRDTLRWFQWKARINSSD